MSAVAWVTVLLVACGDDCPRLSRCDVRDGGCQRSVMEAMVCMRGGSGGDLPAVRVMSEHEYRERIESAAAEDPAEQAEREAAYASWSRGLSLFELAPVEYGIDDAVVDSLAEVAGAYSSEEREIVIIDRGEPLDDNDAVELFAHEIVHALQDQERGLREYDDRWSTSFDSSLALAAVIEGEAVHYQLLAGIELLGRSPSELDWEGFYTEWRSETLLAAEADEAPVALAGLRFPYAFGGGLVTQHWLANGRAGIDALFDDPPRTTSEVLFGSNPSELAAEQETLSEHAVPELAESFAERGVTALGAWVARMYAARTVPVVGLRWQPSRGLGADVFSVHHDETSDLVVAAWRARMLESSSALDWPTLARDEHVRQMDTNHREAYSIAADPALPEDAAMLAWRRAEPEDEGELQTASAAWRMNPGLGHRRACVVRRPRL